jgi:hypothetical protein
MRRVAASPAALRVRRKIRRGSLAALRSRQPMLQRSVNLSSMPLWGVAVRRTIRLALRPRADTALGGGGWGGGGGGGSG